MSGSGFVDKNLFGLKDKLRSYQNEKNTEDSNSVDTDNQKQPTDISTLDTKKETNLEINTNKSSSVKPEFTPKENNEKKFNTNTNSSKTRTEQAKIQKTTTPKTKLDKEYIKALLERKEEFIHKRSDIIKRIKLNLNKLPNDILKYEKSLTESRSAQRKLEIILDKVNSLNEKEWDKHDYTLELAEAVRIIENSRLELFTLQQNVDCLIEEDIPGLAKESRNSILPELTSLSFGQVFKIGIGFFLPLIIGILLASGIITFGMFMAMGLF